MTSYGLTKPQESIYNLVKFSSDYVAVICGAIIVDKKVSAKQLQIIANKLVEVNEAFRIRIIDSNNGVLQIINDYQPSEFIHYCWNDENELKEFGEAYSKQAINMYGQLYDITTFTIKESCGIIIKLHHIISDAWTLSLVGDQICSFLRGEDVQPNSYRYYIEQEQNYLNSDRHKKDRLFFINQYERCPEIIYLDNNLSGAKTNTASRESFILSSELTSQIKQYAKESHNSEYSLFLTALAILINRYHMNEEHFYIGTTVLNRTGKTNKRTAGMYINTIPLLIELNNENSFFKNLTKMTKSITSMFRHQHFNYTETLSAIRETHPNCQNLYDVSLNYQNATVASDYNYKSIWFPSGYQIESLQIHIEDRDLDGKYKLHYDYKNSVFSIEDIKQLHEHIINILSDGITHDTKKIYELNILTETDNRIIACSNTTLKEYPPCRGIPALFKSMVAQHHNKLAVITAEGNLTYDQIDYQSNRIANSLLNDGVKKGDIIAFSLQRKAYLVTTILGIIKSGAAFLPIDPSFPTQRIEYILTDSNAAAFITDENIGQHISRGCGLEPQIVLSESDLCYCIYTSGSTGNPKGTMICHGNIYNNIMWRVNNYTMSSHVLSITNISADTFLEDLFYALFSCNPFILTSDYRNIVEISEYIKKYSCSMMTTPTYFKTIMDNVNLSNLTDVIFVGEALDESLVNRIKGKTQIHNEYGPSECSICVTYKSITDGITIGTPIDNTQIYIVDNYLQQVPVGIIGELCVSGKPVGLGYINQPELTNEKFVSPSWSMKKLYRSGDLALRLPSGDIVFIGRTDSQVKIRGLRIELGEIENALTNDESINNATVIVNTDTAGKQQIVAYYSGIESDTDKIRKNLSKQLPRYMIPHVIIKLESIPTTPSGKIDKNKLPQILVPKIKSNTYIAPEGDLETHIANLMGDVLGIKSIGRTSNFFDLGGDSLKAIELVAVAHSEGINIPIQSVFDSPTVMQMAKVIEQENSNLPVFCDEDFITINNLLENQLKHHYYNPCHSDPGNILLTGSTGFLGIHLLKELVTKYNVEIYCLIRGHDFEECSHKLYSKLDYYFHNNIPDLTHVHIICSDLKEKHLGITDLQYDSLSQSVDTVINAAATVKHYGSYQYFYENNVKSVENLIAFCYNSHAKLIHISTTTVSGSGFEDKNINTIRNFSEYNLFVGQTLNNVYVRSKFEAERIILKNVLSGLQANIIRIGNLTNRMEDGLFQPNYASNAFLNRIKAIINLGVFPIEQGSERIEFTPVDSAACAIICLLDCFNQDRIVFHIRNSNTIDCQTLISFLTSHNYPMKMVTNAEFSDIITTVSKHDTLSSTFGALLNELDEQNHITLNHNTVIHSSLTDEYLNSIGFQWELIDEKYLSRYISWYNQIGYINQNP